MLQSVQGPFLEATTIVVKSKKWRAATNEFQSRGKVYLFGEIVFTGEIVILAKSIYWFIYRVQFALRKCFIHPMGEFWGQNGGLTGF